MNFHHIETGILGFRRKKDNGQVFLKIENLFHAYFMIHDGFREREKMLCYGFCFLLTSAKPDHSMGSVLWQYICNMSIYKDA